MKYLLIALIATHFAIYSMNNEPSYQFYSQDNSKRFPISDKKVFKGRFTEKTNISLIEVLQLSNNPTPETVKDRFLSFYNRKRRKDGPTHRDVKLLKLMGIDHRLLDDDGEPIEYGDPIILPDQDPDISQDEAIAHIEANQAPPRTTIIQLERHHIEHPEWVDYMPAFLKLAYGWWKEG